MNLQERLLQNEIKHLGQIIQTLSYELIVLQDFLKDEHGSKFERFRANYSGSSESSSSINRGAQRSQKQSTSPTKSEEPGARENDNKRKQDLDPDLSDKMDDADGITIENDDEHRSETGLNDNGSDEDISYYNEALSDSDTSVTLRDPLDPDDRKGGRKKSKIWKYFDKITNRNNKFIARCHICQNLVSSRASRMVEHRLKCKRSLRMKDEKPEKTKNYAKEVRREMKSMKMEGFETGEFSDEESYLCSDNDQSGNDDKTSKKSGRMLDTIWSYYEVVYQNDLRKAKCSSCGQFVSPKAIRMRQHKIGCKGAAITESERAENT